jgi:hypothetical protein
VPRETQNPFRIPIIPIAKVRGDPFLTRIKALDGCFAVRAIASILREGLLPWCVRVSTGFV